jgi:hypothetical protein
MEDFQTPHHVSNVESEALMKDFFSALAEGGSRPPLPGESRFGEEAAFRIPKSADRHPETVTDRPSDRVSTSRIIDAARQERARRKVNH